MVTLHTARGRHVPLNRTIPDLEIFAINPPAQALKHPRLTRLVTGVENFLEFGRVDSQTRFHAVFAGRNSVASLSLQQHRHNEFVIEEQQFESKANGTDFRTGALKIFEESVARRT